MIAILLLSMATTAVDDPVSGDVLYMPSIGEAAVLHGYDARTGVVAPHVSAWTNTTALAKYLEALNSEANEQERAKVLGDPKAFEELRGKQMLALLKGPVDRKEVVQLPDMTPVRVRVLASFGMLAGFGEGPALAVIPDHYLVEAIGGPMKGRFFWVNRAEVRVPGARSPLPTGFDDIAPDVRFDTPEPEPKSAPPLRVEDTSWTRASSMVQVHCRVRNMTDEAIESLILRVIYEDAAENMISSAPVLVGDLQPGELKTISSFFEKDDPRMHHYDLEFEGQVGKGGRRTGLEFSVRKRPAR